MTQACKARGLRETRTARRRMVSVLPRAGWTALFMAAAVPCQAAPSMPSGPWVEANNVFLRYKISGYGDDTVVLLHEASMTLDAWDEIVPWIDRRHRVLRYDLRGFGLSERINGAYSMDDAAGDLYHLLDKLGIHGPVVLVGGAVGGAIALKFAATYPDRVKGVVGISPAAYLQSRLNELNRPETPQAASSDDQPLAKPAHRQPEIGDGFYSLRARAARPDRFARFEAIMASAPPASVTATIRMDYAEAFSAILPKIRCPALIVGTSRFALRSDASFRALAEAIPKGRFVSLPVGHYAAISEPEVIGPVIQSFVDHPT